MKIVILDPKIDAQHPLVEYLAEYGIIASVAQTVNQAWALMSQTQDEIDLAVVHREDADGKGEPGMNFIQKFQGMARHRDMPFIITTETWSDAQCADHQNAHNPLAANAYLKYPYRADELLEIVRAVTGQTLAFIAPSGDSTVHVGTQTFQEVAGTQKTQVEATFTEATQIPQGMPVGDSTATGIAGPVALEESEKLFSEDGAEEPVPMALHGSESSGSLQLDMTQSQMLQQDDLTGFTQNIAQEDLAGAMVPSSSSEGSTLLGSINAAKDIDAQTSAIQEDTSPQLPLEDEVQDNEILSRLPYLFKNKSLPEQEPKGVASGSAPGLARWMHPVGDSVVPGGAAKSPSHEDIKRQLQLREQDVGALSHQLRAAHTQIEVLEEQLRLEQARSNELEHVNKAKEKKLARIDSDKASAEAALRKQMEELRFDLQKRDDRIRALENEMRNSSSEADSLKERVRADLRKIRVHEKELEHKFEVLKKDSEVLLSARENRIVELKRKLDLLEFNRDLLQDRYLKEQETNAGLRAQLEKAARAMRVAGGYLSNEPLAEDKSVLEDMTGASFSSPSAEFDGQEEAS